METTTTSMTPIRKLIAVFTLALAVFTGTTVVAPPEASAHTNGHAQCLTTWNEGFWTTTTKVRNDCNEDMSIKIEREYISDSGCYWVRSGEILEWRQGFWGSERTKGVPC